MVDFDGKNRFPGDEPWLTDGYGDYIRHFLRAMDADLSLTAPGKTILFLPHPLFSRRIMKDI